MKKNINYRDKMKKVWIQNEDAIIFGEKEYEHFLKSEKDTISSNNTSFTYYRCLLSLSTGELFWFNVRTDKVVTRIYDVTRATFYDDTDNETTVYNADTPIIGNFIRYVRNPNRELITRLFNIFESFGFLSNKSKVHINPTRTKLVRTDIVSIHLMTGQVLTISEELVLVEENEFFKIVFEFPYEEVEKIQKDAILGLTLFDYGYTINENLMFKL